MIITDYRTFLFLIRMSNLAQRKPEIITQYRLANEAQNVGDTVVAKNGCVSDTLTYPAEYQCDTANPNGWYPKNGEYTFFYDTKSQWSCSTCSDSNSYGCSYQNEPDYGGAICSSCGGQDPNRAQKCAVQRTNLYGDPGACCMIYTSPGSQSNGNVSTGWRVGGSNPAFNNWHFISGGISDDTTFTCPPKTTDDCSLFASTIATECSNFNVPGTYNSWISTSSKNNTLGYCYNYVNNVVSPSNSASVEVLNAALNKLPSSFEFGKNDKTGVQASALNNILNLCSTKGGCDKSLQNICSNKSYNDVLNAYKNYLDPNSTPLEKLINQNIYQACGCHLPPVQYESDGWSNLGVTETCDPICMIPGVVPQWSSSGPLQCSQNLCIINDVKIDIINSNAGNITFNEVCGGCGNNGGGCRCIFSGINVFQSGSTVGNLNFSQNCAGNCQIPDVNNPGNFIPVDCNTGLPSGNTPVPTNLTKWDIIKKWANNHKFELLVIVIALIIAIFILLVWLNKKPHLPKSSDVIDQITLSDLFNNVKY